MRTSRHVDKRYGEGVKSVEKRTSIVEVDLPSLLNENEENWAWYKTTSPTRNFALHPLPQVMYQPFAFFVHIAIQHCVNQQQIIDCVYEGSGPASLSDI